MSNFKIRRSVDLKGVVTYQIINRELDEVVSECSSYQMAIEELMELRDRQDDLVEIFERGGVK